MELEQADNTSVERVSFFNNGCRISKAYTTFAFFKTGTTLTTYDFASLASLEA